MLARSSSPQCPACKGNGNFERSPATQRQLDAVAVIKKIRSDGATPGIGITMTALKQCSSTKDLASGREIHGELKHLPPMGNIFVANSLIDMYSKCGSVGEARQIFEAVATDRSSTVVSWNTIIAGYVDCCQPRIALELFQRMLDEGFRPDARTLVAALRACATLALEEEDGQIGNEIAKVKLLETGLALHALVRYYGLEGNVYVKNTLIDMYGKCSSMADARRVFDRCQGEDRSLIAWNTLLMGYAESGDGEEALELFQRMQGEWLRPDSRSYTAAIKACARSASREDGELFEGDDDGVVRSSRIKFFGKASSTDDSSSSDGKVEIEDDDGMNGSSGKSINSGKASSSGGISGGKLKIKPETSTSSVNFNFKRMTPRLYKCRALEIGYCLHSRSARDGFHTSIFVANALIEMYGKCGSLVDARRVFDAMAVRNVVTWGNMVLACAENCDAGTALRLFQAMRKDAGLDLDSGAYIAALKACGVLGDLETGRAIYEEIRARDKDLVANSIVETCVLDFYAKCGSMVDARSVFDSMRRHDLIAWNTLIAGYADQGDVDSCLKAFDEMSKSKVRPDGVTFLSILSACGHAGLVDQAKRYFEWMRSPRFGLVPSVEHYNCMVDVLGRANQIYEAMEMVKQMPHRPNAKLWTSLLSSSKKWGDVSVGKMAFESLLALGNQGSAYVLMANSYENVLDKVD